jgi:hypothetical protein
MALIFRYITFFCLCLLFMACETELDLDLPAHQPRVALNSFFTADSVLSVNLSKSQHISAPDAFINIENAEVLIFEDEQEVGELSHTGQGIYSISTFKSEPGKSYRIKVAADGLPSVEAMDIIPVKKPEIISMTLDTSSFTFFEEEYKVHFRFKDEAGVANYYNLELLHVETLTNGRTKVNSVRIFTDEPDIASLTPSQGRGITFTDKEIEGQNVVFTVYIPRALIDSGEKIVVILKNISRAYYDYETTLYNQLITNNDPFKESSPVYTNVKDGFGIFAGYQADADTLRY